jgi:hypothetical protein
MGTATGVSKTDEEMNFLWIIISNLAAGYLLAVIFGMYGNINTAMSGIKAGALIGFLMAMSYDAIMYATTNIMNMNSMWVDIAAWTAICAITGGVVGGVLGMKSKSATA